MGNPDSSVHPVVVAFQRYGRELQNFLLRRGGRVEDVEDAVQEVFLRLLRIGNSEFVRNPRAYIHGMALHVVREFKLRDIKAGTWNSLEPQEANDLADRSAEDWHVPFAEQLDVQRRLEAALLRLPAAHRTVFLMHKRDGYSYQEIADALGISVHTVDKYLLQAKVKIRTMESKR